MREGLLEDRVARIQVVIPHSGLRSDVVRALQALGFDVHSRGVTLHESSAREFPRCDARIVDLDVFESGDGASAAGRAWLRDGERTLWLVGSRSVASRFLEQGAQTLGKPFSIDALERELLACLEMAPTEDLAEREPILRSKEPAFLQLLDRARRLATQELPLVIEGELGSGRRALARLIHAASPRSGEILVLLDRSEIEAERPERLHEHIATSVSRASGGSLGIVEPGDWPTMAQQALAIALRKEGGRPRCLTLSRRPLEAAMAEGGLPAELHYRLEASCLSIPPIRERPADQPELCASIARRVARELGLPTPDFDPSLLATLAEEGFPGNRLGLESRVRAAMIKAGPESASVSGLVTRDAERNGAADAQVAAVSLDLKVLERDTIIRALAHWRGNRTRASESLGISVRTLRNKIRDYGLR